MVPALDSVSVSPDEPSPDRRCIRRVGSFAELVSTPFADGINALCWPRLLAGDFSEIAARVGPLTKIRSLDEDDLLALELSPNGQIARDTLVADLRLLREAGLAPELNLIPAYPRSAPDELVPTDVYSYHADSADSPIDTFLCSYTVAASEGLAPADALRCADLPATRARLLAAFGGADDATFDQWLAENFFDLHYVVADGARPFDFGLGNVWRIATDYPGSPVPPCVHRAPETSPGQPPRLLLIS